MTERKSSENVILAIVSTGVMMAAIDTTIVILAIPEIMKSLNADLISAVWTILAYILVVSTLTTLMGRLGDHFGRSKIYNIGFLVFAVSSYLCAVAPNIQSLILFRGIQGIGGAMLQANSSAILTEVIDPRRLGRAFSFAAIGWNSGATLGIVLGGVLTTYFGWQSVFLINVPIGVVAFMAGLIYLRTKGKYPAQFDVIGAVTLLASLTLISYGIIDVAGFGLTLFNSSLILSGLLLLVLTLAVVEPRVKSPIINVRLITNRDFSIPLFVSFFQSVGYLSIVFLVIMYLQGVLAMSPLMASLVLVPGYVLASLMAVFSGRIIDNLGYRLGMTVGLVLMIVSVLLYTRLGLTTPVSYVVLSSVIGGLGAALYFPANNKAVMVNAPRESLGAANGLQRTLANIGTILSYTLAILVSSTAIPKQYAFEIFVGTTVLTQTLAQEFLKGLTVAFAFAGAILAVALVLAVTVQERRERSLNIKEGV